MNIKSVLSRLVIVLFVTLLLTRCDKEKIIVPLLTIAPVTGISYTSATSGGVISNGGGAYMTAQGVCWGTTQSPTINDSKTVQSPNVGTYVSQITGLRPGTLYFIRAYATNPLGTGYSNQLSFTTLSQALAAITTNSASSITTNSAITGGNVTSDGGSAVSSRGVCWSTNQNPTIDLTTKLLSGTGLGTFNITITGLSSGTTYYVRAFATTSMGTSYGTQVSFTTLGAPVLTTTAVSSITSTSAASGGNVSSDGGYPVTVRGICWSTSSNPTTALSTKTSNGTGTGIFTSNMTGLTPGTTYYVRAYATNNFGTSYGNQLTFSTLGPPILSTSFLSGITTTTAISGGNITSDGGSPITSRGVCWSTNPNPTTSNNVTSNGTGTGSFTSNILGLNPNTTYYVRAYAVNSSGTGYGNELILKTFTGSVTDIDGNGYNTVTIGTQVWMVENLKTTKYNDGTVIPLITDQTSWNNMITPGYCWYNNDRQTYGNVYGALYNWYAVNTAKLCPTGWHVPTNTEWNTFKTFIGGSTGTSLKIKEPGISHWISPNSGVTNETGFTALPAGFRVANFGAITTETYWWSSTSVSTTLATVHWVISTNNNFGTQSDTKYYGHSVRCLKD